MMWQQNFIFLSDIDLIKEVLKKSEASARPPREKPFHDFKFGDSEGNFVFYGRERQKKLFTPAQGKKDHKSNFPHQTVVYIENSHFY